MESPFGSVKLLAGNSVFPPSANASSGAKCCQQFLAVVLAKRDRVDILKKSPWSSL